MRPPPLELVAVAGVLALMENSDQYRLLQADLGLIDSAVNEILRWGSTNAYVLRVPTRDVEIKGKRIKVGEPVTLWNASANRDEAQFTEPNRFLVRRSPNRHITYGVGIHRCVGSVVAQVELPILFRRLAHDRIRFDAIGEVTRLRSNFIQGITSLPVQMKVEVRSGS